jgi:hypothetical protein
LIGALQLSEEAKYLEECGNREDVKEINRKSGAVISHYREYLLRLQPLFMERETNELPQVEEKTLQDALSALKEFVAAFDFDSADSVMQMLGSYCIPENYLQLYQKLKSLMAEVARDEIIELLKTIS